MASKDPKVFLWYTQQIFESLRTTHKWTLIPLNQQLKEISKWNTPLIILINK